MRQLDITDLVKITANGIDTASFTEIRAALTSRYKSIYGSDIDVSTGSADGIFVNDTALLINNILQAIKTLYSNLDINSASGVYLDSLCNLANIFRKPASNSIATLLIHNVSTTDAFVLNTNTEFVDKAGTIWIYSGNSITLAANAEASIKVVCSQSGKVAAPAGWITTTVILSSLNVIQNEAAIEGSEAESDSQLRARRNKSNSSRGITVLESLVGALLSVEGIEDALIVNNPTSVDNEEILTDGSTLLAHSIYVVLKQRTGIEISDSLIGSIIYERLTPGIQTSKCSSESESKEYEYPLSFGENVEILSSAVNLVPKQIVYWKNANPINPTITFKIKPLNFFSDSEINIIGNEVIQYANTLSINQALDVNEILSTIINADPLFKGSRTYAIQYNNISIVNTPNTYTFYNYKNVTASELDDNGEITISIT